MRKHRQYNAAEMAPNPSAYRTPLNMSNKLLYRSAKGSGGPIVLTGWQCLISLGLAAEQMRQPGIFGPVWGCFAPHQPPLLLLFLPRSPLGTTA